jgi:hypothetical protein
MAIQVLQRWRIIFKNQMMQKVDQFCDFLEQVLRTCFELMGD